MAPTQKIVSGTGHRPATAIRRARFAMEHGLLLPRCVVRLMDAIHPRDQKHARPVRCRQHSPRLSGMSCGWTLHLPLTCHTWGEGPCASENTVRGRSLVGSAASRSVQPYPGVHGPCMDRSSRVAGTRGLLHAAPHGVLPPGDLSQTRTSTSDGSASTRRRPPGPQRWPRWTTAGQVRFTTSWGAGCRGRGSPADGCPSGPGGAAGGLTQTRRRVLG